MEAAKTIPIRADFKTKDPRQQSSGFLFYRFFLVQDFEKNKTQNVSAKKTLVKGLLVAEGGLEPYTLLNFLLL